MKYEITDKREYTTTVWQVETEDDTYIITCGENDFDWEWSVTSAEEGELHRHSDLAKELINLCAGDISSVADY